MPVGKISVADQWQSPLPGTRGVRIAGAPWSGDDATATASRGQPKLEVLQEMRGGQVNFSEPISTSGRLLSATALRMVAVHEVLG
jgi:hypothetical protein